MNALLAGVAAGWFDGVSPRFVKPRARRRPARILQERGGSASGVPDL